MPEHSPEPWRIAEITDTGGCDGPYHSIQDATGGWVIEPPSNGAYEEYEPNMSKADEDRAIACVNALAGIKDPEAWVNRALWLGIWPEDCYPREEYQPCHPQKP